jgi:TRAP-type C4-dicarboxylate transport system substrate-binding protein
MRKITIALLFVSLTFSLLANGQGEATSSNETMSLKFGINGNTSSMEYASALEFKKVLETESNGTIICDLFPNGQLGDAKEIVNQVTMNELDLYMEPIGGLSTLVPELAVLELSYVVSDLDHIARILESDWGKKIHEELKNMNIRILNQTLFG